MKLEQIVVKVRPREGWEAIDLGFKLVRQYWKALYIPWSILLLTVTGLCFALLKVDMGFWALILLWWLKPLYDRFLLHILSTALFDNPPRPQAALSALPGLLKTGLWQALTFRRLSLQRSFVLAVDQLENLRGKPRRDRCRVLKLENSGQAMWLTVCCFCLQLMLFSGLLAYALMMIPEQFEPADRLWSYLSETAPELYPVALALMAFAIFLIEPFYVAAGFMLYINRRTELEAWDIELVFRGLGRRLENHKAATLPRRLTLCALVCLLPLHHTPLLASDDLDEVEETAVAAKIMPIDSATETMESVLERPEYNQKETTRSFRYKGDAHADTSEEGPQLAGLFWLAAILAPVIKFLLITALLVLFVYLLARGARLLDPLQDRKKLKNLDAPVSEVMGMDVAPESLPENIPTALQSLISEGRMREAVALLYRAAISVVIYRDGVPIKSSSTENDIIALAGNELSPQRSDFLDQLTDLWVKTAYAGRTPDPGILRQMGSHWKRFAES